MTERRPRRKAGLSPEERALWREVTRGAVPLSPELRRVAQPPASPEPPDRPGAPAVEPPVEPAVARSRADAALSPPRARDDAAAGGQILRPSGPPAPRAPGVDLAAPAVVPVGRPTPGLDRRTAERIRRGAREPEARIDLHGMTAERAHRALDRCIAEALAGGRRLVLVITGKGGRRENPAAPFARPGEGVLRREAPRWLRAGPHARDIVGIFEAHQRHGGAGAFYVYLKRRR